MVQIELKIIILLFPFAIFHFFSVQTRFQNNVLFVFCIVVRAIACLKSLGAPNVENMSNTSSKLIFSTSRPLETILHCSKLAS